MFIHVFFNNKLYKMDCWWNVLYISFKDSSFLQWQFFLKIQIEFLFPPLSWSVSFVYTVSGCKFLWNLSIGNMVKVENRKLSFKRSNAAGIASFLSKLCVFLLTSYLFGSILLLIGLLVYYSLIFINCNLYELFKLSAHSTQPLKQLIKILK